MKINKYASNIDLSNTNLKELPSELYFCRNLRKLNLSNNQIKFIPKELSKLKNLENIDFSKNLIANLYSHNCAFPKLKVLILNNNLIKTLPKQIKNLNNLKKFSIANNRLENIPEDFKYLKNLQSLNLSNNHLAFFPLTILSFSNLKTLWLNNNNFNEFPIREINNNLRSLNSLYCFSIANSNSDHIASDYGILQKQKGNCINKFNLLALKNRSMNNFEIKKRPTNTEAPTQMRKSIFISYCHADDEWLKKINVVLQTMQYEGVELDSWDDTRINSGDLWKNEIETALDKSHIAILLVSNDFLASKFVREKEVPILLQKAEENGAKILPVIVGLCRFTKSPIGKYQAINRPEKPLYSLSRHEQDEVFYKLTLEIDKILNR